MPSREKQQKICCGLFSSMLQSNYNIHSIFFFLYFLYRSQPLLWTVADIPQFFTLIRSPLFRITKERCFILGIALEQYFKREKIQETHGEFFYLPTPEEYMAFIGEEGILAYDRGSQRLADFLLQEEETEYSTTAIPSDYSFNLCDFALFLSVMKNKSAYQDTLSIILNEAELQLNEVKVEQVILNHSGMRAIRLDAWAQDTDGRCLSTEMQTDTSHDNIKKRARFYQGLMDVPILKSGKDTKYRDLPSTIIIFITVDDLFGCDRAEYTFTEQCEEVSNLHLKDGTKKIFLNMSSKNGRPELVSLLQYMKNSTLDNPEITVRDERLCRLDQVVQEVKQSEEWEEVRMNIYEIGKEQGIQKERERGMFLMIRDYLEEGISPERICSKLQKNFSLSAEEALEKYRIYSDTSFPTQFLRP